MHTVNKSGLCATFVVTGRLTNDPQNVKNSLRLYHSRFTSLVGRVRHSQTRRVKSFQTCSAQTARSPTIEKPQQAQQSATETDVVVIGSGIGGLCCAALLAKYGLKVKVDPCTSISAVLA